jgi:hypothetical protein
MSPGTRRCGHQANSPRTSAQARPTAARSRKCPARSRQMADFTVAAPARAWRTADLTAIHPARTRSTKDLTAIHPARTRSTAVCRPASCRAARCRTAIPWRAGSPGCRTAAVSPLARTAFTGRGHRVRQAEQRAGTPRARHHHIPSPRTRTRSAAAGGGHLPLPLPRPVRPRQTAQSPVRAVRVLAGLRKVRRDSRLCRDPQGFLGPPDSRRHASARARRVPASTPLTAASA